MSTKLICPSLPNMPWQDRPEGCVDPVWRYSENPIIDRHPFPESNSVFNSAAVPFGDGYAGVFRVDHKTRKQYLHAGFSKDGINWEIEPENIKFIQDNGNEVPANLNSGYDPRVVKIEDTYYVTWCGHFTVGNTIALAWTKDFKEFHQMEHCFLPYNRNGVLFPRKINGEFAMLSRPFNDSEPASIFYSVSPDLTYWGKHRFVMKPNTYWDYIKIGPGPAPIETEEGWLMIYHGVQKSCSSAVYSFSAAMLDKDEPWRVKYRCEPFLIAPEEVYEQVGDVPMVCFPCATLQDGDTGRIAIYYGGADTVTCLAFTQIDTLIDYMKSHPQEQ